MASIGSVSFAALISNGDGTFKTPSFYPAEAGAEFIQLADMNKDGHLDAVTASSNSAAIQITLGKGDGTFTTPPPSESFSDVQTFGGITIGDFDGDGYPGPRPLSIWHPIISTTS